MMKSQKASANPQKLNADRTSAIHCRIIHDFYNMGKKVNYLSMLRQNK